MIKKENNYITTKILAKEFNKSRVWSKKIIRELRDKNILVLKYPHTLRECAKYSVNSEIVLN